MKNRMIDDSANSTLSNLAQDGKNISNWSSNVSNCLTQIPQDINLTLSNGTLTLKAGSKVYVPNGAGVFDTITIANDITFTITWAGNSKRFLFVRNNGTALDERLTSFSGGTAPTSEQYSVWYDTTNNAVKYTSDYGSTWSSNCSFPIAIITSTNNVTTAIDQVFNGFGYIGSTVFALPGVKGLIPDGRNADGTLKSAEFTIDSVKTHQVADVSRLDVVIFYNGSNLSPWARSGGNVITLKKKPPVAPIIFCRAYIEDENLWYHSSGTTTWEERDSSDNITELFSVDTDGNPKITNINNSKTAFYALDWNDKKIIVQWGIPDYSKAISVNSNSYTALSDGLIVAYILYEQYDTMKSITVNNVEISKIRGWTGTWAGTQAYIWIPVTKGDVVAGAYPSGIVSDSFVKFFPYKGA